MQKNKSKKLTTQIQKIYSLWLKAFFVGCFINSIILFLKDGNEDYFELSMMIPFIHLGCVWCILMLYGFFYWVRIYENDDAMYIKSNYPYIWKKLHPFGDISINSFASIQFLRGKYDDAKDERLNRIKNSQKKGLKLMLRTFFLVPIIWFCNIVSMVLGKILLHY